MRIGSRAGRPAARQIDHARELAAELPRLSHTGVHSRAGEIERTGRDLISLIETGEAVFRAPALDALETLATAVTGRRDRTEGPGGNPAVYAARRLAAILFAFRDRLAEGLARELGVTLDDRPRHPRLRGALETARRSSGRPIVVRISTGHALSRIPWWRTLWVVQLDSGCPPRPAGDSSSEQDDLNWEHAHTLQERSERYLLRHGESLHVVLLVEDELGLYHTAERVFGPFDAAEAMAWVAGCRWEPDGEVPAPVSDQAAVVLPYRLFALIERRRASAARADGQSHGLESTT